jgi:uncharacterized protein YggU (UPF0235/DUF167 family)
MACHPELWRKGRSGIELRARVVPRSRTDLVEGIDTTVQGAALKVRVRAVPDQGSANRAVERVVAEWLGVPKTSVTIAAGTTSRIKRVHVKGADEVEALVRQRVAALSIT